MRKWDPKSLWNQLCEAFRGWMDEEREQATDPSLAFHMTFTAPLLILLFAMMKR